MIVTAANTTVQYSFMQHPQRIILLSGRLRSADFFGVFWVGQACLLIYVAVLLIKQSQQLVHALI